MTFHEAYAYARQKAIYGHRDWLAWEDQGDWTTARDDHESLRAAIASGGKCYRVSGTHGTAVLLTPAMKQIAIRNANSGFYP